MKQLSWHSFPQRLGRAALLAAVVALMTMLIGVTLSLSRTVSTTADALIGQGRSDLMVQPTAWLKVEDESALPNVLLSDAMVAQINQLPGVEAATPLVLGRGVLAMSDDGQVHSSLIAPTVSGSFDNSEHSSVEIVSGRNPVSPDEVVMDEQTLKATGHGLDEEVQLIQDTSSSIITVRVVGTVKVKGHDTGSASFIFFNVARAQQLFTAGKEEWNAVALQLADGADQAGITSQIKEIVPFGYSVETPATIDRGTRWLAHPALASAQATFTGAAVLLVAVAVLLTSTTFGRLASHQRQAMASMRALGANRRQTWVTVMTEALVISAAGALVGAVLALVFQGLAHGSAVATNLAIGSAVGLDVLGFLLAVLLGVVCTLIGAHPHAMAASRAYPITARVSGQPPRWLGDEAWSGLGLMGVGLLLLLMLRLLPSLPVPMAWALFGSAALTGGAVISSALICQPVMRWLGNALSRPFGGLAKVATSQAVGHPSRLTLGVSAMLLGAALMTAPAVISASGERTAEQRVPQSFSATHLLRSVRGHHFSPEVATTVGETPGVSAVSSIGIYEVDTDDGRVPIAAAAPGSFEAIFATTLVSGRVPEKPNEVMVSTDFARTAGVGLSDLFSYKVNWKPAALRIVGIYEVAGDVQPAVAVAIRETVAERGLEQWDSWIGFTAGSSSPEEIEAQLKPLLDTNPLLEVTTPAQLGKERAETAVKGVESFQEVGRLALICGLAAVALLLILSVMDREREYGSLRVIGANGKQIGIMLLAEGAVLSVLGVGLGILTGAFSGWGIRHTLLGEGYSVLSIPWGGYLLLWLLAIPLGILAAVPAAFLGSRTEVTDSAPINS